MTDMAERYLLGSILLDHALIYEAVALNLRESDFSMPQYRAIWNAMICLCERNEPCDTLTVTEETHRRYQAGQCAWVAPSEIYSLTKIMFANIEPLSTYADIIAPDRETRSGGPDASAGELLADTTEYIKRRGTAQNDEALARCALCGCDADVMCPDCPCHPEMTMEDISAMGSTLGICAPCMDGEHEECLEADSIFPESGPCKCRTCGGGA